MATPAKRSTRTRSTSAKASSAQRRDDTRVVKAYLEAVAASRPKRGRKRNPDSMRKRLAEIDRTIDAAPPLTQLHLQQERIDIQTALASADAVQAKFRAEKDFVKVAKRYGADRGITYEAWRAAGVTPQILRDAGITPVSAPKVRASGV
jgi:hypothetical protein